MRLSYEIDVVNTRQFKSAMGEVTREAERSARKQAQFERALAAERSKLQKRIAVDRKAIEKLKERESKSGTLDSHRVKMRTLNEEASAIRRKVQAAREAERLETRRHSDIMRRHREQAAWHKDELSRIDKALTKRGIFVSNDTDIDPRTRVKDALSDRAHRKRVDRLRMGGAVAGSMLGTGAQVATLGGSFALAGAVYSQRATHAAAAGLANQGFDPNSGVTREQKKGQILGITSDINKRLGVSQDDVIAGMTSFVDKTGKVDMAMQMADFMAKLSSASGTDIGELGTVLGNAYSNISKEKGVTQEQAVEKAKAVARVFAGQGKAGAVEMKDLAARAPILTSAAGSFEGDLEKNMGTIGALTQIAVDRGGAANADIASTAMKNIALDIAQKAKKVGVTDAIGADGMRVKDPVETIARIIDKTGGSLAKLQKVFGRETLPGINGLAKVYVEAGKGKAGIQAIRDLVAEYQSQSYSETEMEDSANFRASQLDRQLDTSIGQFNSMVGDTLVPALGRLVPHVTELVPAAAGAVDTLGNFIGWAASDPFAGLSALFAAGMAKEIAKAQLGKLFQTSMGSALGSGLMTIGAIYGTVKMAEFAIQDHVSKAVDKDNKRIDDLIQKAKDEQAQTGSVSEETRAEIEATTGNLQKRRTNALVHERVRDSNNWLENGVSDAAAVMGTMGNMAAELFTGEKRSLTQGTTFDDRRDTSLKEQDLSNIGQLTEKMQQLNAALEGVVGAQKQSADALSNAATALESSQNGARSGSPISSRD